MCGIVGILCRNPDQVTDIEKSLNLLIHRGPDDRGRWNDNHIYLGHTRLSILDLSPRGHQPMSYQNQRFWITFNGEIYNYLELQKELLELGHRFTSQSDTEVLLAAYSEWGKDCLEKLRGMFALAIWDNQNLFLARDRCGEKPLYYWYDDNTLYFASELKALVAMLPQLPHLDPVAVDLYLHYQYVPEPLTPLVGITKLPAAHYIQADIKAWQIKPQPYWNLAQVKPVSGNPVKLIRQELENAITFSLRSDVPVGIALSGGIDSGAIASLAAPKYKETVQAFSIGYPGRPPYDEREQAEELAKQLGLPFFDIELKTEDLVDFFPSLVASSDDPIADIASYGHYAVMKLASEHGIKVMLSGIGGDELFWGYSWTQRAVNLTEKKQKIIQSLQSPQIVLQFLHSLCLTLNQVTHNELYDRLACSHKVPKALRSILNNLLEISLLDPAYQQQAVYQNLAPDFWSYRNCSQELYTKEFAEQIPNRNAYTPFILQNKKIKDLPIQICQILFDGWLASNCLALGDRLSMSSSVELRLPLLDYKLIELVMGLRQVYPDHNLSSKAWLKSALDGILPNKVLNRKKQGFQPPTAEWMNAIIQKYKHWLDDGYLANLGIFEKPYLNKMINNFTNRGQHRFTLYKMLVLETWYRKVVIQCH
jgi:asparagine synthase (glutamine-hydrolysing)